MNYPQTKDLCVSGFVEYASKLKSDFLSTFVLGSPCPNIFKPSFSMFFLGTEHDRDVNAGKNIDFSNKAPKGVDFGVRIVFDGNKLSNDFEIRPYKFSTLWEESEEFLVFIGDWGNREKLKKHQLYNLKRYILSIDLIPKDIYNNEFQNWEEDKYEIIGIDVSDDLYGFDSKNIYFSKRALVNKAKEWFESKGYDCRIIGKFNKKTYLSDREIINKIEK